METRLIKKIFCPKCGHSHHRYRMKTNEIVCLYCGHAWKNEEFQNRVMAEI